MRPFTRRRELRDLEEARRLVSAAERRALEEAEELRRRAEQVVAVSEAAAPEASATTLPQAAAPEAEVVPTLAAMVKEAEALVVAALSTVADETARAVQAREEAERIRRQALEDAEWIRAEARRQAREEAGRLAAEVAHVRAALERTRAILEPLRGRVATLVEGLDRPA